MNFIQSVVANQDFRGKALGLFIGARVGGKFKSFDHSGSFPSVELDFLLLNYMRNLSDVLITSVLSTQNRELENEPALTHAVDRGILEVRLTQKFGVPVSTKDRQIIVYARTISRIQLNHRAFQVPLQTYTLDKSEASGVPAISLAGEHTPHSLIEYAKIGGNFVLCEFGPFLFNLLVASQHPLDYLLLTVLDSSQPYELNCEALKTEDFAELARSERLACQDGHFYFALYERRQPK